MTCDILIIAVLYGIICTTDKDHAPDFYERMVYMTAFTLIFSLLMPLLVPFTAVAAIIYFMGKKTKDAGPSFAELPETPEKQEKTPVRPDMNASNIMLLIGTAFVILSGIAFGAAGWVKTSDLGRVLIIAGASAVSFLLSFMLRRLMKLENTSAAFYAVGSFLTAVTFIVAGAYELMGQWLSLNGEGYATLIGLSLSIVIIPAFIGRKLYGSEVYSYIGAGAGFAAVFAFISQILMYESDEAFAAVLICAQAAVTAVLHAVPLVRNKAVRNMGDLAAIGYAAVAFSAAIDVFDHPRAEHFFIIGILYVQFLVYGIWKNKNWMKAMQAAVGVYGAMAAAAGLFEHDKNSNIHLFWMSVILFALYLANRFIPALSTKSGKVLTYSAAGLGAFLAMVEGFSESPVLFVLVPGAFTAMAYLDCFSRSRMLQACSGVAAPLMVCLIAAAVGDHAEMHSSLLSRDITAVVISSSALILMAAAAVIICMPKIAFRFHANHPRTSDSVIWTSVIISGAALFSCLGWSRFFWLAMIAAAAHIALSQMLRNNITAAASAGALPVMICSAVSHYTNYQGNARSVVCFAIFIIYMAVSRIFFSERIVSKTFDGRTKADFTLLSGWICFTLFGYISSTEMFLAKVALAVYIACFVKKKTSQNSGAVLLTVSAVITAYALTTRPFFIPDSAVISSKISLAVIALTGQAVRFIWRHHKEAAVLASNLIFISAFTGLIFDAMRFHTAPNTIFVMAVTILMLFIARAAKSKTWFTASSAALVIITLYSTRRYLMALDWWVYLFAAGIVLISAAAYNEYCKKNGSDLRRSISGKFSGWKW